MIKLILAFVGALMVSAVGHAEEKCILGIYVHNNSDVLFSYQDGMQGTTLERAVPVTDEAERDLITATKYKSAKAYICMTGNFLSIKNDGAFLVRSITVKPAN